MDELVHSINIDSIAVDGIPAINADFGRVTVLIGANGSGKSRLLKRFVSNPQFFSPPTRSVTYIEGGRVINLPNEINLDWNSFGQFSSLQRAEQTISQSKNSPTASRVRNILLLLDRRSAEMKVQHSDLVTDWQENECQGPCPILGKNPLDELFQMFSDVFPEINLTFNQESKQLTCTKNGNPYAPTELSDGERQAFFILADLVLTTAPDSLIIVDEPELNLNALLADRLWNTVEDRLPDAVFVYGTHSIGFAMRQNVDTVVALSRTGQPGVVIDDITDISAHDVREFLGAIPAILSSPGAVAVEGIDTSFDGGFYRWILQRQEIAVVPLGGSIDVMAAATRLGIWNKLAPTVQLLGIIDRDYKSEAELAQIGRQCLTLEYHEAESYLCHPRVLSTIANALGTVEQIPTESEITDLIFQYFETILLRVALRRMANRAQIRLNVSLEGSALTTISDEQTLRNLIQNEAKREEAKASTYVGVAATMKIFDEELARCRKAISDRDLESAFRLVPGKELLARLAPRVGCKDAAAVARAAVKHVDISKVTPLESLRTRVNDSLGS